MSIKVNPPPQQNLPPKILNDPELAPFFLYQQEYLFKLWLRTGGGADFVDNSRERIDFIESLRHSPALQAQLNTLLARIGTGDPLTCDDTGFTCDNTHLTCDRTEY